jgi:hypothetical protein
MNILGTLASAVFFLSPVTGGTQASDGAFSTLQVVQEAATTDIDQDGNGWQ